jgi:molybdate transport system ATP-binding protein
MLEIDIKKRLNGDAKNSTLLEFCTTIEEGSFIALWGVSGSGKTTLLRVLAGLEVSEGRVVFGSEIWQDGKKFLSPQKRSIGFVFQEYALFENMTVEENLLYVKKDKVLAQRLLDIVEMATFAKRYPATLSGGQKQRIAICRALMHSPKLLLLDEPLSALDTTMRRKLQNELQLLHKEFKLTIVMVSHDLSEIYHLAQRVLMLENAKIVKDGTPQELLLKNHTDVQFSFHGEIIELREKLKKYIAIVMVKQQLIEVEITKERFQSLEIGMRVEVGAKEFVPTLL